MHQKLTRIGSGIALLSALTLSANAASFTALTASGKQVGNIITLPDSTSEGGTLNDSIKQTISLTPEEYALLQSNTTLEIKGGLETYRLSFNDDPKYKAGATSVKIKKTIIGDNGYVQKITASFKLKSNTITITLKSQSANVTGLILSKPKTSKDYSYRLLQTNFIQNSSTVFTSSISVLQALNVEATQTFYYTGGEGLTQTIEYKTAPLSKK